MKIVGSRHQEPDSPARSIRRAERIIAEANRRALQLADVAASEITPDDFAENIVISSS